MRSNIISGFDVPELMMDPSWQDTYIYNSFDGALVIVSCAWVVRLDEFTAKYNIDMTDKDVYIYCEELHLGTSITARNLFICVRYLVITNILVIDVSGACGKVGHKEPDSNSVQPPTDGLDAGTIYIQIEDIEYILKSRHAMYCQATGGHGGDNPYGDGTNGGNGGTIEILASHPIADLIDALSSSSYRPNHSESILENLIVKFEFSQDTEMSRRATKLSELLQDYIREGEDEEDEEKKRYRYRSLVKLIEKELTEFLAEIDEFKKKPLREIYRLCRLWCQNQEKNRNTVKGGFRGLGGESPLVKAGKAGVNNCKLASMESLPSLNYKYGLHPLQCAMIFNRTLLRCAFLDMRRNVRRRQFSDTLARLYVRAKAFEDTRPNVPGIPKECEKLAVTSHTLTNLEFFKVLARESKRQLDNMKRGTDCFGHKSNYVPLITVAQIRHGFIDLLINNFKVINKAFVAHTNRENNRDLRKEALIEFVSHANRHLEADIYKKMFLNDIDLRATHIDCYSQPLRYKRGEVEIMLDKFHDTISECFDFNPKDLLKALSKITFEPDNSYMQLPLSAELTCGPRAHVADYAGVEPRNEYMVDYLNELKYDLKLLARRFEYIRRDEDADVKVPIEFVAERDQLTRMMRKFYLKFPPIAGQLRDAFEDYVDTIILRNTEILNYSSSIKFFAQIKQDKERVEENIGRINDQLSNYVNADDHLIHDLVFDIYHSLLDDLLRAFNLGERALALQGLEFRKIFLENMLNLDCVMMHMRPELLSSIRLQSALRLYSDSFSPFKGTYKVKDGDNLKLFKRCGLLLVDIEMAKLDDQPDLNEIIGSNDVRLSHVSVYINGLEFKQDDSRKVLVQIVHGREDYFKERREGKEVVIVHEPVLRQFEYDSNDRASVTAGANFLYKDSNKQDVPLLGPFTKWTISLPNYEDYYLDNVESVDIELVGVHGSTS